MLVVVEANRAGDVSVIDTHSVWNLSEGSTALHSGHNASSSMTVSSCGVAKRSVCGLDTR